MCNILCKLMKIIVVQGVHCETMMASNLIVIVIGCNNKPTTIVVRTTDNLLTIDNLILCVHTSCK